MDTELKSAINSAGIGKLTLIGIHNNHWIPRYRNFCNRIDAECGRNIGTFDPRIVRGLKWHAKIFILKSGGVPIFAIIGSSNITSRAFGIKSPHFNFEADVVLWDDSVKEELGKLCKRIIAEGSDNFGDVLDVDYNSENNRGITMTQRLKDINAELDDMDEITKEFDWKKYAE